MEILHLHPNLNWMHYIIKRSVVKKPNPSRLGATIAIGTLSEL